MINCSSGCDEDEDSMIWKGLLARLELGAAHLHCPPRPFLLLAEDQSLISPCSTRKLSPLREGGRVSDGWLSPAFFLILGGEQDNRGQKGTNGTLRLARLLFQKYHEAFHP